VAEWSNAAVLKTVELKGSGGSNPSLSATTLSQNRSEHGVSPPAYPLIAESLSTTKIHQAVAGAAPVDFFRNEIADGEIIVQSSRWNRKMG
jgi:hypothetical protein